MLIQIILVLVVAVIILRLIFQLRHKAISLAEFFGWFLIWLVAIVIVLYPQITSFLAIKVGVGRGVDLVVYVSLILIFYLLFRLLIRIEKTEKEITKIVRRDALEEEKKI